MKEGTEELIKVFLSQRKKGTKNLILADFNIAISYRKTETSNVYTLDDGQSK